MCGIIGIIDSRTSVAPLVLDGLRRLEYRGYDSAGIACLADGKLSRRRASGKLGELANLLAAQPMSGNIGIGHTRWATHGKPTENNAHPHMTDRVAVVHNGIIENFMELRDALKARGIAMQSETDTEIVMALIDEKLRKGQDPITATKATLKELTGAFALAIIFAGYDNLMIGARRGSPLAVGYGGIDTAAGVSARPLYLGSDAMALAPYTQDISYLENGDLVVLQAGQITVYDENDQPTARAITKTAYSGALIGKGRYRHFMQKEIFEQPEVVGQTLYSLLDYAKGTISLPAFAFDAAVIPRATIVGCGTAFFAGMVGKYWLESLARIPTDGDVASEFRYRDIPFNPAEAAIFMSQSGETADTLAALRTVKAAGLKTIGVINVPESSIAREVDQLLSTHAGPEIGVASTKAFTTQLTVLACLAIGLGEQRGTISPDVAADYAKTLRGLPSLMTKVLELDSEIADLAHDLSECQDILYMARGNLYPIALEGALKLKELSYIHAEGYAAGELKHGAIALIDEATPVVVLAPSNTPLFEKTASNLQEVVARGGNVLLVTDEAGADHLAEYATWTIVMPDVAAFASPILYALPMQMLAYHIAAHKGTDVDQPRNLAKSVTVE